MSSTKQKHSPTESADKQKKFKLNAWRDKSLSAEERGEALFSDFSRVATKYSTLDMLRQRGFSLYHNVAIQKTTSTNNDILINKLANAFYTTSVSMLNVIGVVCDSLGAAITAAETTPKFMVAGAASWQREMAKQCTAAVAGVHADQDFFSKQRKAFWDAMIFGTGALKHHISDKHKKVCIDYVPSVQLYVPNLNTTQDDPDEIFQVYHMSVAQMLEEWPEHEAHFVESLGGDDRELTEDDVHRVVERWKIGSEEKPGYHSIGWQHGELFGEDWTLALVPFTWCWYSRPNIGFYGTGVVSKLADVQKEMNYLLLKNQQSIRDNAVTKWIIPPDSGVTYDDINSEYNTIIEANKPPMALVPNAILPPAVMQTYEMLWNKAYEITGINSTHVQGEIPRQQAGASGIALQNIEEQAAKRFSMISKDYANMVTHSAKIVIMLLNEIADKSTQDHIVKLVGHNVTTSQIPWNDIRLDDEVYVIRPYNASYQSLTPAAQFSTVEGFMKLGMTKAESMDLIGMPDTEEYSSLVASELQAVRAQINRIIINKSLSETIDPLCDQQAAADEAKAHYFQYLKRTNPNEKVLDLLRSFIGTANIPKAQQPASPTDSAQQQAPAAKYAQQENMLG